MECDFSNIFPKSVFKYRSFNDEEHKRIITHQEIYFSPPSKFIGDDITIKVDDYFLKNDNNVIKYYDKVKNQHSQYKDMSADEIINEIKITDNDISKFEMDFQKTIDKCKGFFSAGISYSNNHLWKIYGDNKKGFCVEIDPNFLSSLSIGFGKIDYKKNDELPRLNPTELNNLKIFKYLSRLNFTLPEKYYNENEFRIVKSKKLDNIENFQEEDLYLTEDDRKIILPENAMRQIILGARMKENKRCEILELIKEHLPDTPVKRIKYGRFGNNKLIPVN